jgi:hypothetical protein
MHRTRTGFGRLVEFGADAIVACTAKPESLKIAFENEFVAWHIGATV